jgi:hypothetical protein
VGAESAKRYREKAGDRSKTGGERGVHAIPINLNREKTKFEIRKSRIHR